jgi:ribosome-associated heat shock protein Hsp15
MTKSRSEKASAPSDAPAPVRLDKWLWAARFFKTRSLASDAVSGGMVSMNGERAKAAKATKIGDELVIRRGQYVFTVIVRALSDRRRGAAEAQELYEETEDSVAKREETAELNRANALPDNRPRLGRPSKRDRRLIGRLKGR